MDMADIHKELNDELTGALINPRTEASRKWFLDKVQSFSDVNRGALIRQSQGVDGPVPGKMFMFWYEPKGVKTLPYYDRFPLIIMIGATQDGMLGLNLHYLPTNLRAKFFYGLLNRVNNKRYDDSTYIKVTYDYLKAARSAKEFRPCIKRYLTKHIRGKIAYVPANEWEVAIYLPTAAFVKEDEATVHRISESMIERF